MSEYCFNPLSSHDFYVPENRLHFPTTQGLRITTSIKLVYQYIAIFLNFSPTSNDLDPLQGENCDSNSRLVVDQDDNVNSGLKGLSRFPHYHGNIAAEGRGGSSFSVRGGGEKI